MRRSAWTASLALAALGLLTSSVLADQPGFTSPSGNITCYIEDSFEVWRRFDERGMACLVFGADWVPPANNDECGEDQTPMIVLSPGGPAAERLDCHGDVFWPMNGVIGYGSA